MPAMAAMAGARLEQGAETTDMTLGVCIGKELESGTSPGLHSTVRPGHLNC